MTNNKATKNLVLKYGHLSLIGGRSIYKALRYAQGWDDVTFDPNDWNTELVDWQRQEFCDQADATIDSLKEYGVIPLANLKLIK